MLRLAPPRPQRFGQALPGQLAATFAGAEANTAVAIAQLGGAARFITTLPARHPAADAAVRELNGLGVETRRIQRSATGRLGLYYYEPGATARAASVSYDRDDSAFALAGPSDYPWDVLLAGASRLHLSGITPAVSAAACAAGHAAVAAARRMGLPVSLDVNFRATLWRWSERAPSDLATRELSRIAEQADVLLAGPADVALLLGGPTPPTAESAFVACAARFPNLRHIACSHRTEDASARTIWSGRLFDAATAGTYVGPDFVMTEMVDRLGIGDAFAGGLLRGLAEPAWAAPDRALALATAAGALKHGLSGDYLRASLDEAVAALAGSNSAFVRR